MNPLKPLALLADSLLSCIRSDAVTRAHMGFAWPEPTAAEQELQAREEAEEVAFAWGEVEGARVIATGTCLCEAQISELENGNWVHTLSDDRERLMHEADPDWEVEARLLRHEVSALNERLARYRQAYHQATGNYLAI